MITPLHYSVSELGGASSKMRRLYNVGQDLTNISLLVQRYGSVIVVAELDPKEGVWGSQITHLELRFKSILDIPDFLLAGPSPPLSDAPL
jgi:hypothetical protein